MQVLMDMKVVVMVLSVLVDVKVHGSGDVVDISYIVAAIWAGKFKLHIRLHIMRLVKRLL